MYGEVGDLSEVSPASPLSLSPYISLYLAYASLYLSQVSAAGSAVGTCVLWTWAFSSQVLLVNILISMMTETYEKAYPWP